MFPHQEHSNATSYLKVMVVDDTLWTLSQIQGFLQEAGIECDGCTCLNDAIARLRRSPSKYGLVFLNISFGRKSAGLEAAKIISGLGTTFPPKVIGMTGVQDQYDYKNPRLWGMHDIIKKPLFKWLVVNLARDFCSVSDRSQIRRHA